MRKTILFAAGALCLFGCGGRSAADGLPIAGKLTVHTGPASPGWSVHVLLGDGTRFDKLADPQGDVVFQDPDLQGAQTITVVTQKSDGSYVAADTVLGINRDEVWTRGDVILPGGPLGPPEPTNPSTGTVSGKLTGASDPNDALTVSLVAQPAEGAPILAAGATPDSNGAFSISSNGFPSSSVATLLATEHAANASSPVRVGMRMNVPVDGDVSGQDVVLDHPVDQAIQVEVENSPSYSNGLLAQVSDWAGYTYLFETFAQGPSPVSVPTIQLTPPFDSTSLSLSVSVGLVGALQGSTTVHMPLVGSSVKVSLPPPAQLLSPVIGRDGAPTDVAIGGLRASWSAGEPWQLVTLAVRQPSGFSWQVTGAAGARSFDFFPLPADAAPTGFSPGLGRVTMTATQSNEFSSLESYYGLTGRLGASHPSAFSQSQTVSGEMNLN